MALILALILAVSQNSQEHPVRPATGKSIIQAVTGNGRLNVGIDSTGRIAQLRWPTLGFWDHMAYDFGVVSAPTNGAYWIFVEGSTPNTFAPEQWDISSQIDSNGTLITRFRERNGNRSAVQKVYVPPKADLVVIDLILDGFSPDTTWRWYQHLAPATSLIAGIPDGYIRFQRHGGFAAYYDEKNAMMVQFRPKAPQHSDWLQARRLARSNAPSASWSAFPEGVYWGTFSTTGTLDGQCAPVSIRPIEIVDGTPTRSVAGAGHAILQLLPEHTPGNKQHLSLCLAVAPTGEELLRIHQTIVDTGKPPPPPGETDTDDNPTPHTLIKALLACVDSDSGAVVRAPISYPPLAYAAVFDSMWAVAALDKEGHTVEGERVLRFHLETMRTRFTPSGAPGSLPADVHTTGTPARFHDQANPTSTAWLLAAIWRHSAALPPEESLKFLHSCEDAILIGGDFLSRAVVVGGVLSGIMKPGATSLATLQTQYLGLVSARSIMERLGRTEPTPWKNRREEAYARIRFRQLDKKRIQDPESIWLAYWVSTLPEGALSKGLVWQILISDKPPNVKALLELASSEAPEVSSGIPVALRAALAILSDENRKGSQAAPTLRN